MLEKFDFVLIRSQFVKEPFLFKAFEENALTLLVQSKECLPPSVEREDLTEDIVI
jgi:hypothetical protein